MTDGDGAALVWFRDDLRVGDNPALSAAAESGAPILCIYIHDEDSPSLRPMGGANRWWLHGSLAALDEELRKRGAALTIFQGPAADLIDRVVDALGAVSVYWNRRYGAAEIAIDSRAKAALAERGVDCRSFSASLLCEPWEITTGAGTPMRVFTPFWKAVRARGEPAQPLSAPRALTAATWKDRGDLKAVSLATLGLEPTQPNWAKGFDADWTRGEAGAKARVRQFLTRNLRGYADGRDRPDLDATSRLSPHLRFGEISPRQIWRAATQHALEQEGHATGRDVEKFLAELGWREFSYHLLFHNPQLAETNLQRRFDAMSWTGKAAWLESWRRGRTGYPFVDAGMRQLWATGWMHNRVRMIAASFLIKHLQTDWREGERWFWDTLVDADPANNAASWQWVAGSGADAAPYFRIFNPVLQGEKFDPNGDYVRRWAPELAKLPNDVIHQPWRADPAILKAAGVRLGDTYPKPIVDHAAARDRALAAFASIRDAKG